VKTALIARQSPVRGAAVTALCLLAVSVVTLLQLRAMSLSIEVYDEGLALYGAGRTADGAMPYRDFWSMYAPGSFYALAALDRLFSETVFVGRCFDAVSRALIVVLVFAVVRRRSGSAWALVGGLTALALLIGGPGMLAATLPATAAALVAMLGLEHVLQCQRQPRQGNREVEWTWVGTGAAAGISAAFRQDLGLYLTLVCLGTIAMAKTGVVTPRAHRLNQLLGFGAGLLAVTVPSALWLLSVVPIHDLYESLVRIPTGVYASVRSLPFPTPWKLVTEAQATHRVRPLLDLAVYFPVLIAAVGAAVAIRPGLLARGRNRPMHGKMAPPSIDVGLAAWVALDLLFCLKGAVRTQFLHMVPALVVSIVLTFLVAPRLRWRNAKIAFAMLTVVAASTRIDSVLRRSESLYASSMPIPVWSYVAKLARGCDAPHGQRLGCFLVEFDNAAVLDYLLAHGTPGTAIYVGTTRHDKLLMNNVELYFLSGMPSVTKWHDLHPGVQTTREIQSEMIRGMQANPPAFVVLNSEFDSANEDNGSRASSGVTLLDNYLRASFSPVFSSGTFTVSVPKSHA
jgi:hypothetical protein